MAFGKRPIARKPSIREQIAINQTGHKFYAALTDRPPMFEDVPPRPEQRKLPIIDAVPALSERQIQSAVISWWDKAHNTFGLPQFALFAIPNGGTREMIEAVNLKRSGVKRGVYDLMLAAARHGGHGLFIEMKAGKGKPSTEQIDFGKYLDKAGYVNTVQWSSEGAIRVITDYLTTH